MSAVADKLREARALVERGWTQEAWARDGNGNELPTADATASCWCAYGAIAAVYDDAYEAPEAAWVLRDAIGQPSVTAWNDAPKRTQAEVLAAFDKAIELAESGK